LRKTIAQIVGYGVVGKAQAFLMKSLGFEVVAYDPEAIPGSRIHRNVDVTFICVPEWSVESVVDELCRLKVEGLYVIKSTVPVGTTEKLMEKHKIHICHNPEFLREKQAFEDVMNPDRVVIGQCCEAHGRMLMDIYSKLGKPIYVTTPRTSELVKLVSNAHLAMLITFWNVVAELADKLNVNIRELAEMVVADRRISKYGTAKFGEPFGGKCLPKDLDHLINCFHSAGLNPTVFEAVKAYNSRLSAER